MKYIQAHEKKKQQQQTNKTTTKTKQMHKLKWI